MIKPILFGAGCAIAGAAAGAFAFLQILPANDVFARQDALEDGIQDWFFVGANQVFPTRTVSRSETGTPLPVRANALEDFVFDFNGTNKTLDDMFTDMETTGLVVLKGGEIVYERYQDGSGPGTYFTTFSLVKSFTSTLVGFAIEDGHISDVEDPLDKYLSELAGTAYEGVTIRQALEMSSGVRFDPGGYENMKDTLTLIVDSAILGKRSAYDIATSFPRASEPGTDFNYNTAESQVLLELVRRATGKDAASYLEEKMWRPLGMSHDAAWILDGPGNEGAEFGGAFFNASLRDWARFGLFIEQNGYWNGKRLLPENWVQRATRTDLPHLQPGQVHANPERGYAWHWWTLNDGTFTASGANGQTLFIDQENDIVVARSSTWPLGWVKAYDEQSIALFRALGNWSFELETAAAAPATAFE